MTMTIAMAGKGGTGKTTIAGLLIRFLLKRGVKPILAVDADANANLNEVLGLKVETTLGEAREGIKDGVPTGMTRDVYMAYKIEEALVESQGYDLVVMGRPEGPTRCFPGIWKGCAETTALCSWTMRQVWNTSVGWWPAALISCSSYLTRHNGASWPPSGFVILPEN